MIYVRQPVVAGKFYEMDKAALERQIEDSFNKTGSIDRTRRKIRVAVVPHAGYMYSGWIAAHSYKMVEGLKTKNYIIMGPNHSLAGSKYALMNNGLWETPLGGVTIHENMAMKLQETCPILEHDVIPHQYEHSIEVQLPFLQYMQGNDFKFVPITVGAEVIDEDFIDDAKVIGKSIAKCIKDSKEAWFLIVSSDFSHYIPKNLAENIDRYAIDAILKLDETEFLKRVEEKNASICGAGAVAIGMVVAKTLGSKSGRLLKYSTSAEANGDDSAVVGYASIIL